MTEQENKIKTYYLETDDKEGQARRLAQSRAFRAHSEILSQELLINRYSGFTSSREHLFVKLRVFEKSFTELCVEGRKLDPQMFLPTHVPRPAWEYDHA